MGLRGEVSRENALRRERRVEQRGEKMRGQD